MHAAGQQGTWDFDGGLYKIGGNFLHDHRVPTAVNRGEVRGNFPRNNQA